MMKDSLEGHLERLGETAQPSMYDEMVWDTLTEQQQVSVAKLVHGGFETRESELEKAREEGFDEGHREGVQEGREETLESPEMTNVLRERLREVIGADLRDIVREVLTNEVRHAQPVPSSDNPERVLSGDTDVQPPDGP